MPGLVGNSAKGVENNENIIPDHNPNHQNKKYFPFKAENPIGNDVILVTLGSARPDRDEGEVGHHQNLWLERTLKKYENKTSKNLAEKMAGEIIIYLGSI